MKTIKINEKEIPVYCTLEEAEEYFSEKYSATVWNKASDEDKKKALVEASRQLSQLRLKGFVCQTGQPLLFPRFFKINYLSKRTLTSEANKIKYNGRDLIYMEQSTDFKIANAEQASFIMETANNVHLKNQELGIQSINIGAGTVSYRDGHNSMAICAAAMQFVDKFLVKTAKVV